MGLTESNKFYRTVSCVSNDEVLQDNHLLVIDCPEIARQSLPGQFVMIKPQSFGGSTLLARPYSIYKREGTKILILYKRYGKGSKELSRAKTNDSLTIWGPLGNGFLKTNAKEWFVVAGGVGIAPFVFLAQEAPKHVKITMFIGIRNKDQAILEDEFKELKCELIYVSEDGSKGEKGLVTNTFDAFLKARTSHDSCEILTCGPRPMEAIVAKTAAQFNIPCQVAYEEYMACGMGTCMGCVVKCRDGEEWSYKRVCREGPVFMADKIMWGE